MTQEDMAAVIESVRVLSLLPTDILVLKVNQRITHEQRFHLHESAQTLLGVKQKIVVLEQGIDIEVLRQEAA